MEPRVPVVTSTISVGSVSLFHGGADDSETLCERMSGASGQGSAGIIFVYGVFGEERLVLVQGWARQFGYHEFFDRDTGPRAWMTLVRVMGAALALLLCFVLGLLVTTLCQWGDIPRVVVGCVISSLATLGVAMSTGARLGALFSSGGPDGGLVTLLRADIAGGAAVDVVSSAPVVRGKRATGASVLDRILGIVLTPKRISIEVATRSPSASPMLLRVEQGTAFTKTSHIKRGKMDLREGPDNIGTSLLISGRCGLLSSHPFPEVDVDFAGDIHSVGVERTPHRSVSRVHFMQEIVYPAPSVHP